MDNTSTRPCRRMLLTASAVAAGSAAASLALGRAPLASGGGDHGGGQAPSGSNTPRGYRLSEHVSRYYRTTRI
jgi:hypothetical protein